MKMYALYKSYRFDSTSKAAKIRNANFDVEHIVACQRGVHTTMFTVLIFAVSDKII